MRYILFSFLIFLSPLYSISIINTQHQSITISNAITLKKAKKIAKTLNKFDTYIYKTTATKVSYYVIYVVNLEKKNLKENLKYIKTKFHDAYISSTKRTLTLASNNFKKNIFIEKLKTFSTVQNNNIITEPIVKKAKPKPKFKPKNTWIDNNKYAITLHTPIYYEEAKYLANKYRFYDTYIYRGRYNFIVSIVNIHRKDIKQFLKVVQADISTATATSRKTINFFSKQLNSTKALFTSAIPMPVRIVDKTSTVKNKIFLHAKQEFNKKNYKKAIIFLTDFLNQNSSHIDANFLLGRAYYITKQFELAFTTYQKMLIINENLARVRLELAQTYLALNMTKEALNEFNNVANSNVPQNVKTNIEKRIEYIKSLKTNYKFNYMLAINYIKDNNINNAPATDVFTIFPFLKEYDIITRSVAEELFSTYLSKTKSQSVQYIAGINHKYKINDTLQLATSISQIKQKYKVLKSKDLGILTINSSISKSSPLDKISFNIGVSKIETIQTVTTQETNESNETVSTSTPTGLKPFMTSITLGINYSQYLSKTFMHSFGITLSDKSFNDSSLSDKESRSYGFTSSQQLRTKNYGNISLKVFGLKEKRKTGDRTDVNNINYGLNISNSHTINKKLSLRLATSINRKIYKFKDLNYQTNRQDTVNGYTLGFNYKLYKNLMTTLNLSKTKSSSNQGAFKFKKNTQTFGLMYSF